MKLEWMGRYRSLVQALIFYSNASNRTGGGHFDPVEGVSLNKMEYQILECICENEDENKIMSDIALSLGVVQSNVTKATKKLVGCGLVERYKFRTDKKKIILKPTALGKRVYTGIYQRDVEPVFRPFFDHLASCSDEELQTFETAVRHLSRTWYDFVDTRLEKIED